MAVPDVGLIGNTLIYRYLGINFEEGIFLDMRHIDSHQGLFGSLCQIDFGRAFFQPD